MSFSLFSKNKKDKVVLLYDIGSASVGGALVLFSENEKPKIVYSTRKEMTFQKELDFKRFVKSMQRAVEEVSFDLQKRGLSHLRFTKLGYFVPQEAHCVLASPWYASKTKKISIKKEKDFIVSDKNIRSLIGNEVKNFSIETGKTKHIDDKDISTIEKRIVQIKLNGYETAEPFGKKASSLELSLVLSVAQKDILDGVKKSILSAFSISDIGFSSFSLISFDSIRDIAPNIDTFLFLDISGEITDVSLIKDDVLLESVSFPIGKNNIIRMVIEKLNVSADEAVSLILMYNDGSLGEKHKKTMQKAFTEIEQKWIAMFQKALIKLSADLSIPSTVFFTSDEHMEQVFSSLIKKEEFGQFTMTDDIFSVIAVNSAFLSSFVNFSKGVKRDPFLTMEALFLNKAVGL